MNTQHAPRRRMVAVVSALLGAALMVASAGVALAEEDPDFLVGDARATRLEDGSYEVGIIFQNSLLGPGYANAKATRLEDGSYEVGIIFQNGLVGDAHVTRLEDGTDKVGIIFQNGLDGDSDAEAAGLVVAHLIVVAEEDPEF